MYWIDEELCLGCAVCAQSCPQQAIRMIQEHAQILPDLCTDCGICAEVCPQGAIRQVEPAVVGGAACAAGQTQPTAPGLSVVPAVSRPPAVRVEGEVLPEVKPTTDWRARLWPAVGSALIWAGRELLPELLAAWRMPSARTPTSMVDQNPPLARSRVAFAPGRQLRRRQRGRRGRGHHRRRIS